jgi:hypothetical protein
MSNADDGRNISDDEGAVFDRCRKFCEVLFILVPLKDENGCSKDSLN